ncbi:right-handed parallel beta-helix repeat-containing protein [Streptomyces virginiae]|uniref:right-handed parallel beta-helix repeat-containing protein n=1 Tax=Streptomyces virginiae TaxID=1961 RepID=UPI0036D1A140
MSTPLPVGIPTVVVKGTYRGPDGRGLSGTVTFSGPPLLTFPVSDLFIAGPVVARLDENGHFEVTLPATNAPNMNPADWSYTVKENLTGVSGARTYSLLLPSGSGPIDLADVAPSDPSTPTYTPVVGPKGDRGSTVYSGTAAPTGALGADNDLYTQYDVRTLLGVTHTTVTVWLKASGSWVVVGGDIRGAAWYVSNSTPAATNAKPGDLLLRSDTGDVLQRGASTWGSAVANLKGATGATGSPFVLDVVAAYGAVGNGTTDDTTAIQNALNAAGVAGGTVVLPGGKTYRITNYLNVKSNVTIIARGATIRQTSTFGLLRNFVTGDSFATYSGYGGIVIEGGVWDANASDGTTGSVTGLVNAFTFAHAQDITLRDVTVRNVSSAHAVELNAVSDARIINCRFEGFRDNTGDTSRGFSEAIQLDYSISGGGGIGAFDNTPCRNIRIEGCYFGASSRLAGFGRAVGSHTSVSASAKHDNVQVLNCTVVATGQEGIRAYGWMNSTISRNRISGTGSACIVITGPDPGVTGYSNVCSQIAVHGNTVSVAPGSSPIRVVGFATARPTGVSISGNVVFGSTATGIYVSQATAPQITANQITDAGSSSIYAINCSAVHIVGNQCVNSASTALGVDACTGGFVSGNNIEGTVASHGLFISGGSDVTVQGNRVNGAKGSGIRATTSTARCRIINNTVLRAGVTALGIDVTASATGVLVINNDLTGSAWPASTALSLLGAAPLITDWAAGTANPGQNLVS